MRNRAPIGFIGAMVTVLLFSQAGAEERAVNFYNWSNYTALERLSDAVHRRRR
jgi:spermidine/putrescine-binding protein